MSTETFSFEHIAGANLYVRLFDITDGKVFDFDDNTFKTLASATTPYKTATERADMAGTGRSGYTASINLSNVNDTGEIQRFELKVYNNATPADADNPVGDPLSVTVQFGKAGERDVVAQGELSVKSTLGDTAQITAWLEHAGQKISIQSNGGTIFTADSATDKLTATAHGLNNNDRVLLTTSGTLPTGLNGTTAYYVVNKTANDFEVSLTSGGAAVNFSDNGTGVHRFHNPTCSVSVREHGSGSDLAAFPVTADAGDLVKGGTVLDQFDLEVSSPNFTDDRQFEMAVTITENGNSHSASTIQVSIG